MTSWLDERCTKCGETLRRMVLLAMLQDAGAKCIPGALDCEHDFQPVGDSVK